jgi:2,3-diketo-5-methylthio-1-phosphopentane phosphatase
MSQRPGGGILVSDFDGTMTRVDFFQLVVNHFLPPGMPDYWTEYRTGRMTHFEAVQAIYGSIRHEEDRLLAVLPNCGLDPHLPQALARLRKASWDIIVASAGCDWYIRRLLADCGAPLEIHANPGRFQAGRGLCMVMPVGSPYRSGTHGIDKAAVVRAALASGRPVAFAGDGNPDLAAARLVPAERRFARRALAAALHQEGLAFHSFEQWSEIAEVLLQSPSRARSAAE